MKKDAVIMNSIPGYIDQSNGTSNIFVDHNRLYENKKIIPEILFISSFPPRECGIATYTQDLINALTKQFKNSFTCKICALESEIEKNNYNLEIISLLKNYGECEVLIQANQEYSKSLSDKSC